MCIRDSIIDRNVNYTNICVARCNFGAFYRTVGSSDGYVLGFEEIFRKIDETIAVGGNQLLLQGGHNPDLPIQWYEDLFRAVKGRYPEFKLHALSPPEVLHISRLNGLSTTAVIERLIAAGLDSIPGGGEATGVDYLRTLALSRIVLDNFDNLQASWVTQGGKVGQLSLAFGANDMGSVMIEENVVRAAGASYCMDEVEIVRNIENAGFVAKRRNMHYDILGDPICRERDVPRMLELAKARAEGDTSVPEELSHYPARSRSGKQQRSST